MKAIETEYNGFLFRSRLEARWAVFFDTLGVAYRYEPEGYVLRDGTHYLPDFWLPELDCWIEIKPSYMGVRKSVRELMWAIPDELRTTLTGFGMEVGPIILFQGVPDYSWGGVLFALDTCDSGGGAYMENCGFAYCNVCHRFLIEISDRDTRLQRDRVIVTPEWEPWRGVCGHRDALCDCMLEPAILAARQARFEYGQVGAPSAWEK